MGSYAMSTEDYNAGRRAYRLNPDEIRNPHPIGSQAYNDFERGWVQEHKQSGHRGPLDSNVRRIASNLGMRAYPPVRGTDPGDEAKRDAAAYAKATGRC
jgi:hypothetical protein